MHPGIKQRINLIATSVFLCCILAECQGTKGSGADIWVLSQDTLNGKSGYLSPRGDTVIPFGKYLHCFTDTFQTYAMVLTADQRFAVIDRKENVVYEVFNFDNGPDYPSEGLFRMLKQGKLGYADAHTYEVRIPPAYDCAFPFENGRAKVSKRCTQIADGEHLRWESDAWLYIDRQGNRVGQ